MVALTAGALVVGGAQAASAAPATFNPFDANNGFTIVSQGDAYLNNGELEGSIASLGSISSGNQNGYPVVHQAAGEADYTVPKVDGVPVRILADEFTGGGAFDVVNRDDSGTISPNSPEANAVVKLVDTDGLTGSARGGGSGNAAGQDFLRITNPAAGIIDLKTVPFAGSDVGDYRSDLSPVAAYFPGLDAQVTQTNTCLTSMYDPALALTNPVSVDDQGGLVFVEGFAADRPNVIDYTDIAGKTVKLDRAGGYKPTANAPLVIRVPAGTTDLGQLRFEGWSAQAGAQQSLARYILLDLSAVTGTVTVNGLEMGAIWAPNANLNFNSGVTTNGQWFAKNVTTAGGGEIHHHTFLGNLPCGDTPVVPGERTIGTTVSVPGSADKVLPLTGGTVTDTVAYTGLTPGTAYTLSGDIRTAPAGTATGITATASFTPENSSGTTAVTFTITADQVAEYAGQDLVVFEYLTLGGAPVAEHTDPTDTAQTFTVADEVPVIPGEPKIGTTVSVHGSATKVLP
ncbi:collagen-binding domain-containing protein, partial [Rhodococcus erythropolis]|uniref:collagen-binding domain-containing protein n=1 Tax=Rhodococcus erythropolis TaxID=1833 RepID=UPI0033B4D049